MWCIVQSTSIIIVIILIPCLSRAIWEEKNSVTTRWHWLAVNPSTRSHTYTDRQTCRQLVPYSIYHKYATYHHEYSVLKPCHVMSCHIKSLPEISQHLSRPIGIKERLRLIFSIRIQHPTYVLVLLSRIHRVATYIPIYPSIRPKTIAAPDDSIIYRPCRQGWDKLRTLVAARRKEASRSTHNRNSA